MNTSYFIDNSGVSEESDADRRRGILADNALSLDFVSALAGDRALTKAEKDYLDNLKKNRGLRFYSDLFYSITHQYFVPEVAEKSWIDVYGINMCCRRHWGEMSELRWWRWTIFQTSLTTWMLPPW